MTKRTGRSHIGRPSEYRPEFIELAHKLALLMATDDEIADCLCVSRQTLDTWRKTYPEFLDAITRGKLQADAEVGHALKHRALGYSHDAVKIFMPAGSDQPVYAPYVEHYPPDTQAASLWLRNRQPGKWRDRHEHTGADGGPLMIITGVDRGDAAKD